MEEKSMSQMTTKELSETLGKHSPHKTGKKTGQPAGQELDKIGFWVSGKHSASWEDTTLEQLIEKEEDKIHTKIGEIKSSIQRYHEKTVKKKTYLYHWEYGKWKYIKGGMENDPRIALEASIKRYQEEAKSVRAKMKLCIIREIGDHLIIRIPLFTENVQKNLPKNVIPISEMLSVPAASSRFKAG